MYDTAKLVDEVLLACRSASYVPPVTPAVALQVLAMARRPEVSFADVARVCESDPLVAARVLRLAQSAFFSRGAHVATLKDAIVRLGVQTLAQLFLSETMTTRVFRAPGYDAAMSSLRRHSAMTAHVAQALAGPTSLHREHAFTCGLLHDVGVAAAAYIVGTRVPFASAWPAIMGAHQEAGKILCRAWKLPAEVEVVVAYHHHGSRVGGTLHLGACLVAVAEWLATDLGFGLDGEALPVRPETEMRILGVTDAALASAKADAKALASRVG